MKMDLTKFVVVTKLDKTASDAYMKNSFTAQRELNTQQQRAFDYI